MLAGLSMPRAIVVLSWPILLESFLNSLVGLTDTLLAAQLSTSATGAIGGASYILWFIGLVIMAIGVGATALISRAVGAGRLAVANAAVGQTVLLAIGSGVCVGAMVAMCAGWMSGVMNLSGEGAADFTRYMVVMAVGVPCSSLLYSMTACLRGAGDSLRPLMAMVVVNAVNMVVSFALAGVDITSTHLVNDVTVTRTVLHNPFGFGMGVKGIAWGTVIAEAVGAAVIIGMIIKGRSGVRLKARRLRPHWHTMMRLVRVGIPNFLETFGMWVGNFFIILMVGWLGSEVTMGAHIVAIRIESFSFMPGFAIGVAAATLAGQYLGAGSPVLARRSMLVCTGVASVVMGLLGVVFVAWPTSIAGLITSQPEHLALVPDLLRVTGCVQIPFAIGIVLRTGMRGAGDVKVVMWLTWLTTYGVRLPLAYVLSGVDVHLPAWLGGATIHHLSPTRGLVWLWVALCLEIVVRAAAFAARFVQGGWVRARV